MTPSEKFEWLQNHGTLVTTEMATRGWGGRFVSRSCVVSGGGATYERCIEEIYDRVKTRLWDSIRYLEGEDPPPTTYF